MKNYLLWKKSKQAYCASAAVVLSLFCFVTQAQVITPPSGFITLTIRGTGGATSSRLSFLGLGMTRPVEYQGNFESFGANSFTDDQGTWADDQFNGANGTYYLELTSGPYAGLMTDIVDTLGATKHIMTADDFSTLNPPLSGGTTYKIRKHWTLGSLFGTQNEAGLGSGSSLSADEILVYNPLTALYTTYYYKTAGLIGGTGWRTFSDNSTEQANTKINLSQGLLIRRKQASNLNVKIYGAVKSGNTAIIVQTGLNIIGNVYPVDTLTLGNSGLYTGSTATGLAGGSAINSDQILLYDGAVYKAYYFKTQGLVGGTGWRSVSDLSADASSTVIPSGASFLIQRLSARPPFTWYEPQTF